MDHDAYTDPDVVLCEAVEPQSVVSTEKRWIVIDLECTYIDTGMYLDIQTAADRHREIVLRFGDRRIEAVIKTVARAC